MILKGVVEHGKEKGRKIGFPTANLKVDEGVVLPEVGVYASRVLVEGWETPRIGITNVGQRPTADEDQTITIETNVLDFSGDLYGKFMEIELGTKIRGLKKFDSMEDLAEQLKRDAKTAKSLYEEN